jgi:hypothetical protein
MNIALHTEMVYTLLAIAFVCVMIFMITYNLRMRRRQKSLESGSRHLGTEEGIAAATEAEHQAHSHKH